MKNISLLCIFVFVILLLTACICTNKIDKFVGDWKKTKENGSIDNILSENAILEITKQNDSIYKIIYDTDLDAHQRTEIIAILKNNTLTGSYMGFENVEIELKNKKTIFFTVNPFHEFEPILKDEYQKIKEKK